MAKHQAPVLIEELIYIGLGSNLAQPTEQLKAAQNAITALAQVTAVNCSSLYRSPPMGPQDQPDYVNAVMAVQTTLAPLELLHCLQDIENQQGRVRQSQRWTARTLDLDILLFGNQCIDLPELQVPHIGLTERAFVLYPLFEIAPALTIPNIGDLALIIKDCPLNGLERLSH